MKQRKGVECLPSRKINTSTALCTNAIIVCSLFLDGNFKDSSYLVMRVASFRIPPIIFHDSVDFYWRRLFGVERDRIKRLYAIYMLLLYALNMNLLVSKSSYL